MLTKNRGILTMETGLFSDAKKIINLQLKYVSFTQNTFCFIALILNQTSDSKIKHQIRPSKHLLRSQNLIENLNFAL